MFNACVFLLVTGVCVWCFTPRVFRLADTWCARQRALPHERAMPVAPRSSSHHLPEEFFDAMARSLRRHMATREALLEHAHLLPPEPLWNQLYSQLHSDVSVEEALQTLRQSGNETATLLAMCAASGGLVPEALDHAAHILRGHRHAQQSLHTATAQARLTMRLLTVLPFAVLAIATVVSSSVRSTLLSPAVLCAIVFGIALNRLGAWWVSVVIHRAATTNTLSESVALVDALCVAVQAGHTIIEACMLWGSINAVGARIAQHLLHGATLHQALQELVQSPHASDTVVAHTLIAAHADGLPVHSTAALLAAETRKTQQARFQTSVQQLPTKLSLPLVLCVLPSFGLLVLAPLLLAHLARFGSILPSPLT